MTTEHKLREALEQAATEIEVAVAFLDRHYPQRAERMSVFLSVVRGLLSSQPPTSDEGAPTETPLTDATLKEIYEEHKAEGLGDFSHYFGLAGDLKAWARELEKRLHAKERELEQLRVQLAGCGVAAMSNTRESLERAKEVMPGSYGWSASYGDCLKAAEREIELREQLAALQSASAAPQEGKAEGEHFCMHPQCEDGWIRDPDDPSDPGHACHVCTPKPPTTTEGNGGEKFDRHAWFERTWAEAYLLHGMDNREAARRMCNSLYEALATPPAATDGFVIVPRDKLEHLLEYWNGNANQLAMEDALNFILDELGALAAAPQSGKKEDGR